MCVEGQRHQEDGGQHHEEHDAEGRGVPASEHVQRDLECVSQEQNGRTDDEPFPSEGNNPEGNTGQSCVCQGCLSLFGHVVEGLNEGQRMGGCHLGEAGRSCVLHRPQPVHESNRNEQHDKGVVVGERPRRVGDVCGHECDEPRSQNACTFSKVVLGHAGNGEHGQRTVDGRESEHAPPNGVFGRVQEGFECHRTDGHGPREQRRTRVDATDGIKPISVHHQVSVVGQDVVDNSLHVPRVGPARHVPVCGSKGVH